MLSIIEVSSRVRIRDFAKGGGGWLQRLKVADILKWSGVSEVSQQRIQGGTPLDIPPHPDIPIPGHTHSLQETWDQRYLPQERTWDKG